MTELRPMMAESAPEAFDDPGWAFEPKWDGVRALAEITGDGVRLTSRNGNDVTPAYPELGALGDSFGPDTVIDGEIVAFEDGRPSFERLQSRMHVRSAARVGALMASIPVVYMAFDLLVLDGRSIIGETLRARRRSLEERLVVSDHVQLSPQVVGDGTALFDAAAAQALEGIVAKRLDSRYESGRRSRSWLKIKVVHEVDAVVVGWRPGSGGRSGSLGSLVIALVDEDGSLRSVGSVGSGFDAASLTAMAELVSMLEHPDPPLATDGINDVAHVNWIDPRLVAVVEYREVTSSGHLRAPVFKGMRTDKMVEECTVDQLVLRAPGASSARRDTDPTEAE